jgi:hypothetical protein
VDEVYVRLMPDVKGEKLEQYVFNKTKEMLKHIYGMVKAWICWKLGAGLTLPVAWLKPDIRR